VNASADSPSRVESDTSIELVGEVDQEGLDALAELLISAARRQLSGCDDEIHDQQRDSS
jgi:hypothetical protein